MTAISVLPAIPANTVQLQPNARDAIIVSSISDGTSIHVLSRYGDDIWDLTPFIPNANVCDYQKLLAWSDVPETFIDSVKSAIYAYWQEGLPGYRRPSARTLLNTLTMVSVFVHFLVELRVRVIKEVTPFHCALYVRHVKSLGLSKSSQALRFGAVEMLFHLRESLSDPIRTHPWPDSSASHLAGLSQRGAPEASTLIIPEADAIALCMAAERCLQKAGSLLDIRDELVKLETDPSSLPSWRLSQLKRQLVREHGLEGLRDYDRQVLDIRTAAYIVLGITSGCRNHELADLRIGAVYSAEEDGEKFHWLKSTSLKTFAGATEWMVPEIAVSAVRNLERWSGPLRSALEQEIADLRAAISGDPLPRTEKARLMKTLHQREADCTRLFLGRTDSTGRIGALSLASFNADLAGFAIRHGINWTPKTHQFRRTFANFVARNGMGDLRYLRHHFKHWSMDMTLLYAKNAAQEAEIFDEILETINTEKVRIVEHWLDDDVLITGGASSPIKTFRRNHKVAIERDRRALAENISDKVTIRGTGHGWCMSDDNGCGGQGLYEATRCSDCKFAVIDDTHRVVWQGLWSQQVELLALDDIGESGKERVRRDIRRISSVLCGLGVDVAVPVEVA